MWSAIGVSPEPEAAACYQIPREKFEPGEDKILRAKAHSGVRGSSCRLGCRSCFGGGDLFFPCYLDDLQPHKLIASPYRTILSARVSGLGPSRTNDA